MKSKQAKMYSAASCQLFNAVLPFVCLQVAREGTKKTVFTNFMDLCKAMNRQQEHVSM
jgi:hypothetical protein